jgi:hypothetical protein
MTRKIPTIGSFLLFLFALTVSAVGQQRVPVPPSWERTSFGLPPLIDLGADSYKGEQGGLYPNGKNTIPVEHRKTGLGLASKIIPLDKQGRPDNADGKIVLLSVGFSNTTMEYRMFKKIADADPEKSPDVVVVDGAQGGRSAIMIADPNHQYWQVTKQRIEAAGVSELQVRAAWLKQVVPGANSPFPKDAKDLQRDLKTIVRDLHMRYPNLWVVYLSNRIYGGYANRGSPEPQSFESGFAVKWLIEEQLTGDPAINCDPKKGKVQAPWMAWGPYLWADGTTPRSDGMIWGPDEYNPDGLHPNAKGQRKVAEMLLHFFKTEETAKSWFVR